jgi:hypothetical protein
MTAPLECQHRRRMEIDGVPFCHDCKEYLVTGVCGTCHRAMDDHNLKDLLAPICPKSDEKVAP